MFERGMKSWLDSLSDPERSSSVWTHEFQYELTSFSVAQHEDLHEKAAN